MIQKKLSEKTQQKFQKTRDTSKKKVSSWSKFPFTSYRKLNPTRYPSKHSNNTEERKKESIKIKKKVQKITLIMMK